MITHGVSNAAKAIRSSRADYFTRTAGRNKHDRWLDIRQKLLDPREIPVRRLRSNIKILESYPRLNRELRSLLHNNRSALKTRTRRRKRR